MGKMARTSHNQALQLGGFFCERSGSTGIVILTKNPEALKNDLLPHKQTFIVADGFSGHMPSSCELIPSDRLDAKFFADKVLVVTDYFEGHLPSREEVRLARRLSNMSVASVISVRKSLVWSDRFFTRAFSKSRYLSGNFSRGPADNKQLIAIGGKAADIHNANFPLIPVLAFVAQYNEADMMPHVVRHLLGQGVDVHIIDNWSNDGSYEKAKQLAAANPDRVSVERFPAEDTGQYVWGPILKRVTDVAYTRRSKYKWAMLNDADEIRWSPWEGVSLQKAFSFLDYVGFSSVDYTLFNLVPTKDGFDGSQDPKKFFKYGEFAREPWAFVQIKSWKNQHKADLASSGGHYVAIPDQLIYPLKFLLAHYPLRSNQQAARKIYKERQPRVPAEDKKKGINTHYYDIKDTDFIRKKTGLVRFGRRFYSDYIVQRLSGIGVPRDKK